MVIDCIPFFNELDILKLRLNILAPLVDRFVIEEATHTFSGLPKELCFEKNKQMFAEFLPKITYLVVDNSPADISTHERDKFQKNALEKALTEVSQEDVLILSDVDEIPNPEVLKKIIEEFDKEKIYHLAQRNFYCYLNMEEISGNLLSITGEFPGVSRKMWLGTKVFSKKNIPDTGIIDLREISPTDKRSVRVENGGWHFGYMGSCHETDVSKRVGTKVVAAAHQEYNTEDVLAEVKDRLILGEDIFGRNAVFQWATIDESYPSYLLEHKEEYEYLIMPPISRGKRARVFVLMKIKRFFRKARRKLKRMMTK